MVSLWAVAAALGPRLVDPLSPLSRRTHFRRGSQSPAQGLAPAQCRRSAGAVQQQSERRTARRSRAGPISTPAASRAASTPKSGPLRFNRRGSGCRRSAASGEDGARPGLRSARRHRPGSGSMFSWRSCTRSAGGGRGQSGYDGRVASRDGRPAKTLFEEH